VNTLLITGTDTDVGKTLLTTALAAYWRRYYPDQSLGLFKPFQSGVGDRELYHQLFGYALEEVNAQCFQAPLAPPLAAELEGKSIDLELAWKRLEALCRQKDWVVVEALGGLGSPVTHETTVADLAWDWRLPTVLVVPVKLGAVGQAVANVALARQSRIHLKGIVLNCACPCSDTEINQWAPVKMIQTLTHVPVLGRLPHLTQPQNLDQLVAIAAQLDLEKLLPLAIGNRV
jgi:dethiobiotin synthetase